MDTEYYKYLSGWHLECNNISKSVVDEVNRLEAEWFGLDPEDETYCKSELDKARFFEMNVRKDKALPPYHFYRERMLDLDREDGVGFVNASTSKREDVKKSWVKMGTGKATDEGIILTYTDGREPKLAKFSELTKRHYGYTCVLNNIRTTLFDKGEGRFTIDELQ